MTESINKQGFYPRQAVTFDRKKLTSFVDSPQLKGLFEVPNLFSPQEVEFTGWNEPLNIDYVYAGRSSLAGHVANFISTGEPPEYWQFLEQRPHSDCPFSRNLEVLLPNGNVLVICGVLLQAKDLVNRRDSDMQVVCTLPDPARSINGALEDLGLETQGYSLYDPMTKTMMGGRTEGGILGGYTESELKIRLELQSMAESALKGIEVLMPRTILSGTYQRQGLGAFYAYLKPLTLNIFRMTAIDRGFRKNGSDSNVFPNTIFQLGKVMREMHDRGFVHLEMHAGNWGLSVKTNGCEDNSIYVGDFETCAYDPAMPLEPKIMDLAPVIHNVTELFTGKPDPAIQSPDYFNRVIFSLAQGYHNLGLSAAKMKYELDRMQKRQKHDDYTPDEMVANGLSYLSWVFGRIYPGFNFSKYLEQLLPKKV